METKDLMKPRWELIAEYPHCTFEKGTIFELAEDGEELYSPEHGYPFSKYKITLEMADKYPHLFRALLWHEKRELGDMPEYVSIKGGKHKGVHEVTRGWEPSNRFEGNYWTVLVSGDEGWQQLASACTPATPEQITTFLTSK